MKESKYLQSGDADYVQIVHTLRAQRNFFTKGDSNIIIGNGFPPTNTTAAFINNFVLSKSYVFIATKQTIGGRTIKLNFSSIPDMSAIQTNENECLLGIYVQNRHNGTFFIEPPRDIFNTPKKENKNSIFSRIVFRLNRKNSN